MTDEPVIDSDTRMPRIEVDRALEFHRRALEMTLARSGCLDQRRKRCSGLLFLYQNKVPNPPPPPLTLCLHIPNNLCSTGVVGTAQSAWPVPVWSLRRCNIADRAAHVQRVEMRASGLLTLVLPTNLVAILVRH